MILTPIDNIIHIRDDKEKRMVAKGDPGKGALGAVVIHQRGAVCEIDIETLLEAMGKRVVVVKQ